MFIAVYQHTQNEWTNVPMLLRTRLQFAALKKDNYVEPESRPANSVTRCCGKKVVQMFPKVAQKIATPVFT